MNIFYDAVDREQSIFLSFWLVVLLYMFDKIECVYLEPAYIAYEGGHGWK